MTETARPSRGLWAFLGSFCPLFFVGAVIGAGTLGAAQPPVEEQFLPDQVRAASATVAVLGVANPVGTLGVLIRGTDTSAWTVEPITSVPPRTTDEAPRLDPEMLDRVRDRVPLADINNEPGEVAAYYYAMTVAHKTPVDALFKTARRDLTYIQIFDEPEVHRGQVIYLEGDLKRLWRFEPADRMKKEGVKDHYEGWIFDRRYPGQPARHCLIFTELPEGIKPGENLDYPVKFAGYLFKRYRVRDAKPAFDAPLLIGRTILLDTKFRPDGKTEEVKQSFLNGFFLVGGITLAFIVGLGLWYRHHDQAVRRRLAGVRTVEFTEPEARGSSNGHLGA